MNHQFQAGDKRPEELVRLMDAAARVKLAASRILEKTKADAMSEYVSDEEKKPEDEEESRPRHHYPAFNPPAVFPIVITCNSCGACRPLYPPLSHSIWQKGSTEAKDFESSGSGKGSPRHVAAASFDTTSSQLSADGKGSDFNGAAGGGIGGLGGGVGTTAAAGGGGVNGGWHMEDMAQALIQQLQQRDGSLPFGSFVPARPSDVFRDGRGDGIQRTRSVSISPERSGGEIGPWPNTGWRANSIAAVLPRPPSGGSAPASASASNSTFASASASASAPASALASACTSTSALGFTEPLASAEASPSTTTAAAHPLKGCADRASRAAERSGLALPSGCPLRSLDMVSVQQAEDTTAPKEKQGEQHWAALGGVGNIAGAVPESCRGSTNGLAGRLRPLLLRKETVVRRMSMPSTKALLRNGSSPSSSDDGVDNTSTGLDQLFSQLLGPTFCDPQGDADGRVSNMKKSKSRLVRSGERDRSPGHDKVGVSVTVRMFDDDVAGPSVASPDLPHWQDGGHVAKNNRSSAPASSNASVSDRRRAPFLCHLRTLKSSPSPSGASAPSAGRHGGGKGTGGEGEGPDRCFQRGEQEKERCRENGESVSSAMSTRERFRTQASETDRRRRRTGQPLEDMAGHSTLSRGEMEADVGPEPVCGTRDHSVKHSPSSLQQVQQELSALQSRFKKHEDEMAKLRDGQAFVECEDTREVQQIMEDNVKQRSADNGESREVESTISEDVTELFDKDYNSSICPERSPRSPISEVSVGKYDSDVSDYETPRSSAATFENWSLHGGDRGCRGGGGGPLSKPGGFPHLSEAYGRFQSARHQRFQSCSEEELTSHQPILRGSRAEVG